MVRHWILIPAFPGSNPGSAVRERHILCLFLLLFWNFIFLKIDKVDKQAGIIDLAFPLPDEDKKSYCFIMTDMV